MARVSAWHSGAVAYLSGSRGVQALSGVVHGGRVGCSSPLYDVGNGAVALSVELVVSNISEGPHVLLRVIPDGGWQSLLLNRLISGFLQRIELFDGVAGISYDLFQILDFLKA